jgi:hypothetical protein
VRICRQDWEQVIEKACDIANATKDEDDAMYEVHVESMMRLLDKLEAKYGLQSRILATRADYVENPSERGALYAQALDLARTAKDMDEIEEIMDSINKLGQEAPAERRASPNGGPARRSGNSDVGDGPPSVS